MAKKTNKFANTKSEETIAPVAEVKTEETIKTTAEPAEAPKTEVPKAEAPKAEAKTEKAAKKPAAKKNAEKPAEKKAADKTSKVVIQFAGKEFNSEEIVEKCKAAYKGDSRKQVKTIDVYVKPEESRAYYVVNGKAEEGSFIEL